VSVTSWFPVMVVGLFVVSFDRLPLLELRTGADEGDEVGAFTARHLAWADSGWDDAPARSPLFHGDIPRRDEPLPRFLDDPTAAKSMRALAAEPDPFTRLTVEILARTGMRVGELCALEADAVVQIGEAHWLRVPVGKLHNDRYVPPPPLRGTGSAVCSWG
jgi:integrase